MSIPRKSSALLVALFTFPLLALGQPAPPSPTVQEWTSHGPEGGDVAVIVIDPTATNVIYAVTRNAGGVFKSVDGGSTWRRLNLVRGQIVSALVVDPRNPSILYAATFQSGVFKSIDRGETWIRLGISDQLVSLAIDPATPSTLYVGTLFGAILKSTDSGTSWRTVGTFGDHEVEALVIDPHTPSTLYAGISPGGVFKSTDAGQTWTALSHGPSEVASSQSLALDPVTPTTLYAVDFFQGTFKSTNGGASWTRLSAAPIDAYSLTIDPRSPATIYMGTLSNGAYKSRDGGLTWQSVGLPGELIYSLAVDPANPSILFAGASGSGAFKSTDGAKTWSAANHGLVATALSALAIDPTTPSTVYAGSQTGFGYKTTDGGLTWTTVRIAPQGRILWTLAIDPLTPSTVYAGTTEGVSKSVDGGRHWTLSSLPSVFAIVVDPVTPSILYAGTDGEGVMKSTDGGQSWATAGDWHGNVRVWSLALDPNNRSILYAATAGSGVFKTVNGGQTWTPASTGLSTSPQGVVAIAVDPQDSLTLYACDAEIGLVRSTDGGGHWGPTASSFFCSSLAIAATRPATVYAGSLGEGILTSQDRGTTWSSLNNGLTSLAINALAADAQGRTVYAGSIGEGVFGYATAPVAPCSPSSTTVCLHGNRFGVSATFTVPGGQPGTAHVVQLTNDSAYLWFFSSTNVEVFLKVVEGCPVNGRFWVFAAGLTNVKVDLFVTDSQTGIVRSYLNPQGTRFPPIQDVTAFPCDSSLSVAVAEEAVPPPTPLPTILAEGTCTPTATTLCLGSRFAVTTTFRTVDGQTGSGKAVSLTADTGYFWFFDGANVEEVVKVLDACSPFQRYWVFAGGLTDVDVRTTVTDTVTQTSKTYVNPQGTPFQPLQDTDFRACGSRRE